MLATTSVKSLLQLPADSEARGHSVDHTIPKLAGKVFRQRQYRVYLPQSYDSGKSYPMVMVLHGCRQNHLSIQRITGFDAIADRDNFIVVYPFVTSYSGLRTENCWGWWLARQRQRGRGEVADLVQIASAVTDQYAVDPERWHICGLSAGAAMSVASLAAYSDCWRSGASVAGVPFGESMRSVRFNEHLAVRRKSVNTLSRMLSRELISDAAPLLIIQSTADSMVGPKLGHNLKDVWVNISASGAVPVSTQADKTHDVGWQFDQYRDKQNRNSCAFLLMDTVEHGWPGGLPGKYSTEKAPNVSQLISAFFLTN